MGPRAVQRTATSPASPGMLGAPSCWRWSAAAGAARCATPNKAGSAKWATAWASAHGIATTTRASSSRPAATAPDKTPLGCSRLCATRKAASPRCCTRASPGPTGRWATATSPVHPNRNGGPAPAATGCAGTARATHRRPTTQLLPLHQPPAWHGPPCAPAWTWRYWPKRLHATPTPRRCCA